MPEITLKKMLSQEVRVLQALKDAKGQWVSGQFFLHAMRLSQYHRAIWNLQHRRHRYEYDGVIEASCFTDEYGFKAYRLLNTGQASLL